MKTTTSKLTVPASVNTPSTKKQTLKFDFAKYAEEHGKEVTFLYFKDGKAHFTINNVRYRAYYDTEMRYAQFIGKTMKVVIDAREDGWVLCYPNSESHPNTPAPTFEALPAEALAFSKRIKA